MKHTSNGASQQIQTPARNTGASRKEPRTTVRLPRHLCQFLEALSVHMGLTKSQVIDRLIEKTLIRAGNPRDAAAQRPEPKFHCLPGGLEN